MTGTVAYALAKKLALGAVSGIKSLSVEGNKIIFTMNNGVQTTMTVPTPKDGISVTKMEIINQHLIYTLSDGTQQDAGEVPAGPAGKNGKNGQDGINGLDGKDGVSVQKIELNNDQHLIFTLTDGTTQDVGSIVTGGLIQVANKNDLPGTASENIIYLTVDDKTIYYYDGTKYEKIITSNNNNNNGYVTKEDIDNLFDDDSTTSNPIDGLQWASTSDIDNLFTGIDEGNPSNPTLPSDYTFVTPDDIDKLFE